jgi:phage antirepressor YoqD-like protein
MNKQELAQRQIYNKLDAIITKLDKIYKTKGLIILNNADLLHIFNISPRTLIKWREENLITYSKVGNKIFYRVEHIIEFLDNNKNEMTP